jgi:hypothetical protein
LIAALPIAFAIRRVRHRHKGRPSGGPLRDAVRVHVQCCRRAGGIVCASHCAAMIPCAHGRQLRYQWLAAAAIAGLLPTVAAAQAPSGAELGAL